MKKPKLDLYLLEYQKIFRILHGVAAYANKGMPPSCLFYNVTGAFILSQVYKIDAWPVMGAAFIKIEHSSDSVIAFANKNFEECNSTENAFHCWVETPNHIIDFTSPIYAEYPNSMPVAKRMFQQPHVTMSSSHLELDKAGDFFFQPNHLLTKQLMARGLESTKFHDFANIALEWSKASRKDLVKRFTIQADDGEIINLVPSTMELVGSW